MITRIQKEQLEYQRNVIKEEYVEESQPIKRGFRTKRFNSSISSEGGFANARKFQKKGSY